MGKLNLKSEKKLDIHFSMSSMTDIVFLLLIFFMITSSFDNIEGLNLDLPKSSHSQEVSENIKPAYLRFPVKHKNAHKIIKDFWDKNILIGDWYTSPIAPNDTKAEKLGYKKGDCPNAEALSKITLNLPTHINISKKQAQETINNLSAYI